MMDSTGDTSIDHRRIDVDETAAPYDRIEIWGWIGLYATGIILLLLVLSHIWIAHYSSSQAFSLKSTLLTLRSPLIRTIDLGLLLFAVVHGMIGVRRIVLDLELFKKTGSQLLTNVIVAVGAVLITWGIILFIQFTIWGQKLG
jgi:succinate dehydrogenase hydrophobic anchor subunit